MAKVLLGVTGSVAAIHTEMLFHDLKLAGHEVKVVATKAATYFFDAAALRLDSSGDLKRASLILDDDEWPGNGYRRGDPIMHIELRRWADALLIAPLDAHTLAKIANGLADNCLTCVARAWDMNRPVVLCPAMNTMMWRHPATARHLRQVALDFGIPVADEPSPEAVLANVNAIKRQLRIVAPVEKKLACDDIGMGALAPREMILDAVAECLR